jgi:hypothetical protein
LGAKSISMESSLRRVRQIRIAALVSIPLFVMIGESLARGVTHEPANTLFHALSFISISLAGATFVVRATQILPWEAALKVRSDDTFALARWRTGYLFLYALCEAMALFGLLLRSDGFTLSNVWGFYLGGFLLLLLYSPRSPHP